MEAYKMIINLLFTLLYANTIDRVIIDTAKNHNIDPKLALSIAKVESDLDPNKIGDLGEYGLFQLRPEYHKVKRNNYKKNTETAIKYLVYLKKRCYSKYGKAWFICFNTGPNRKHTIKKPKQFYYYIKVMETMKNEEV